MRGLLDVGLDLSFLVYEFLVLGLALKYSKKKVRRLTVSPKAEATSA